MSKNRNMYTEKLFESPLNTNLSETDIKTLHNSVENNIVSQFIHNKEKIYNDSRVIYGILNQERKEYIKTKICKLVDQISDDIEKNSFIVDQTLKNRIVDYSYEFYKFVKKKIDQQKISGYQTIVVPVYFSLLKEAVKDDFLDFSFLKQTLKRQNIKQRKLLKSFRLYHEYSKNKVSNQPESTEDLKKNAMEFFQQTLKIYSSGQKNKIINEKALDLINRILEIPDIKTLLYNKNTKIACFALNFILVKFFINSEIALQDFYNFMKTNIDQISSSKQFQDYKFYLTKEILKTVNYHTFIEKFKQFVTFFTLKVKNLIQNEIICDCVKKYKPDLFGKYLFLQEQQKNYQKVWMKNIRFTLNFLLLLLALKKKKKINQNQFQEIIKIIHKYLFNRQTYTAIVLKL